MASLFQYRMPAGTGRRLTGFSRYTELLGRDFKRFFLVNLLTLLGFFPFASGVLLAILSSSILILIPACIVGGFLAGPSLACLYDTIFRSLRDAPGKCMENYKHAWKQNWRQAVLPGIVFCLLLGFYAFMLMMFWWASGFPSLGTIVLFFLSLLFFTMFFSLYWPLLVLFEQSGKQRFQNCLLFMIRYFWKCLGCACIQILYWVVVVLLLPWSIVLLPLTGMWFILFSANFLLYDTLNQVLGIEEQIAQHFPEQAAFYEDDEAWLKRKQEEQRHNSAKQETHSDRLC